jgi:hypothetical protein
LIADPFHVEAVSGGVARLAAAARACAERHALRLLDRFLRVRKVTNAIERH